MAKRMPSLKMLTCCQKHRLCLVCFVRYHPMDASRSAAFFAGV